MRGRGWKVVPEDRRGKGSAGEGWRWLEACWWMSRGRRAGLREWRGRRNRSDENGRIEGCRTWKEGRTMDRWWRMGMRNEEKYD